MMIFSRYRWLVLILIAYAILAAIYSVATPIFEASDEVSHYAVVQHIADTGALPVQQPGVKTAWEQEGSQPPLYYLLVAPLAKAIDTRDAAERMTRNPHAAPGDPSLDANRNLVIHSPAEDFPWRNTTLAVHMMRFISILMGAGTIVVSYLLAHRIFPDRSSIPIGTAALIAFNPMFVFISASVNNDNLTVVLTSLALYLSVQCWHEPAGRVDRSGWWRRLLLGIVLGCAALSKISGLTLLPIALLILTVRHLRQRDWRGWIITGGLIVSPVVLIAGWWYARNVQLYGELFGLDTMVAIAGLRSMSLPNLIPEFDGFRYSYWALFGAVNIVTFPLVYVIFDLFTLISSVGCVIWVVRHRREERVRLLSILGLYVLIVFAGVVRWTMMTPASQGRLMFPAISAIALWLWLGWETIFKLRPATLDWSRWRWAMPVFMLIVALIVPFRDIAPAYAAPRMLTEQQLPSDLKRLDVNYSDQLRLIGYRVTEPLARTDSVAFTLYWQCLKQTTANYSIFAIVFGRNLQELGKRDAYPYHGLYATSQCQPGQIFADPYVIPIETAQADRPTLLRAQIGVKDYAARVELTPVADGQALPSVMLVSGKLAPQPGQPDQPAVYRLGDAIALREAHIERAGDMATLSTTWTTTATLPESYTIFVHVLDANGKLIGQADGLPVNGDYPTDWWSPGETISDRRPLTLPPQTDRVTIGLYRLQDQTRLPIVAAGGERMPNDEIVLAVQP